ncbi:MAG: hypothetical protein AB1750_13840 [Chloroflexota bacterium]
MRSLKYLFTGLLLSGVIFICLLGAFVFISPESLPPEIPLPDFLDTPTPAPATLAPLPTDTPTPATSSPVTPTPYLASPISYPATATSVTPTLVTFTPTLSPGHLMFQTGGLIITGPRSPEEQIRLYEVSLQFIAPSFSEAKKIGEQINGQGYGSPTLICGPLSIAILRGAGLIPPTTVPYDFWLLNPDDATGREKLRKTFPRDLYTDTRIRTRIDRFDWKSQPLQPGDFVYLYAGTNGTFEHMLVVNRVDNAGRAYSVTNVNTPTGFVIKEVMLYDPNDSNAGIFFQWTDRAWADLGLTGYGGFELWRLIPTEPTPLP